MNELITFDILINKLNKLENIYNEYGKIGSSIFSFEEFNCFPENIINLLKKDIKYFKKIIEFYNKKFTTLVHNNENININKIDELLNIIDKNNIETKNTFYEFSNDIIEWLKQTEFFNNIINAQIIISKDELVQTKNNKSNNLNNFVNWRINQIDAIYRLNKNGLETGIHCQATGTGKSYIILYYIEFMKKIKNNPKIILFTERVNILADLFEFNKKGTLIRDNTNLIKLKNKGVCDITDFNIIDRVIDKTKDWDVKIKESKIPTLLVINRAFLTLGKNKLYKNFIKNDIDLVLHDECHNTTSNQCHDFLLYMKSLKVPIIGFSATPLRTGKFDKSKLSEIYPHPKDNKTFLLLTNYNMIFSIQQKLILPPEFFWYQIDSTKKHKDIELVTQEELGSILELLNQILPSLPNKKLVAWCGTIQLAIKWKEEFEKNYKQRKNMKNFTFGLDTSDSINNDYEKFKISEGNCILFCAQKHREGSDIKLLDGCIFLDKVKQKGSIPFIQSIGRVLRLCPETPSKTKGIIIDGYVKDNNEYEKSFIDKIIGYYMTLLHLTEIDDNMKDKHIIDRYIKLLEIIKFDKIKEVIQIDFGEINIRINCNKLEWDKIINKFEPILQHKIQLSEQDKLLFDFNKLKKHIQTLKLTHKKDYDELNLIKNPDQVYKDFWINWYDFYGIDISIFPKSKTELKNLVKTHKLRTPKEYYRKAKLYNLPLMPEEIKEINSDNFNFEDLFE